MTTTNKSRKKQKAETGSGKGMAATPYKAKDDQFAEDYEEEEDIFEPLSY